MTAVSSATRFGRREFSGTIWTGLRIGIDAVLRLGSSLVLSRLLFPEAFGLMALVNVLMAGLAMFSDIGLATSVVQSPHGDEPVFLRTAWTLQVARGLLLTVCAAAFAPLMASVYAQPELLQLIPVAGASAALGGFASISLLRMQRQLKIRSLMMIDLMSQTLALAVMVVWTIVHPTVWALVVGTLVGALMKTILSHVLYRAESLGFGWDAGAVHELLHFGKWIFLSTIAFFLAGQADRLIFGRLLSLAMLGVYGIAATLAALPTQMVWSVGLSVLLPTFSRQVQSGGSLVAEYRRVQLPVLLAGALPVACLAACGPELISVLYDKRYADAGWMLQLLSLGIWLQVPQATSANALLAVGRPRWMAIGNWTKLAAMLALLPLGYWLFGPAGAIGGLAAAEGSRYATFAFAVRTHSLPSFSVDLPVSALVLVAVAAGRLLAGALDRAGAGPLAQLGGGLAAALAVCLPVSLFLLRHELVQIRALLASPRGATDG